MSGRGGAALSPVTCIHDVTETGLADSARLWALDPGDSLEGLFVVLCKGMV